MSWGQAVTSDREIEGEIAQAADVLWRPPPRTTHLPDGQVHVWRASLDVSEHRLRALERTLGLDELDRAGRLRFARDRRRFIAARGMLRVLLSRYLDVDPRTLCFRYGQWGKPFLSFDPSVSDPGLPPQAPESLL